MATSASRLIIETNAAFHCCVSARQSGLCRYPIGCISSQSVFAARESNFPSARREGLPRFPNRKSRMQEALQQRCMRAALEGAGRCTCGDVTRPVSVTAARKSGPLTQPTRTTRLSNFDSVPLCGGFQIFTSLPPPGFLGAFLPPVVLIALAAALVSPRSLKTRLDTPTLDDHNGRDALSLQRYAFTDQNIVVFFLCFLSPPLGGILFFFLDRSRALVRERSFEILSLRSRANTCTFTIV